MDHPDLNPRHQDLFPASSFLGDPRPHRRDVGGTGRPVGGMGNVIDLISSMIHPSAGDQPRNSGFTHMENGVFGGDSELGNGNRIRLILNSPSGSRTVRVGRPATLGQTRLGDSREGAVPGLSESVFLSRAIFFLIRTHHRSFLESTTGSPHPDANEDQTRRIPSPLLASYLLSNLFGGRNTMFDPFEMMARGRYGDYVVNEHGKFRLFLLTFVSVGVR